MSEQPPIAEKDAGLFIGSMALMTALYETYVEHIGITETEGPDGPYIWCACGWRSDDMLSGPPGESYAVHLVNAQHAAAVKALQPIVRRVPARDPDPRTHGLNHAPLPEGVRLAAGFCAGCDDGGSDA